MALLACVATITPWVVRNRVVFGQWVFLRGNFGYEFALGNYHNSFGRGWGGFHPSGNLREYDDYKRMGEAAYIESHKEKGLQFVRQYPVEFVTLTAKRVSYFWDGSAVGYRAPVAKHWIPSSFGVISLLLLPALLITYRNRVPAWQAFFGVFLLYPAPYYLTFSQLRYRHAVEPLMVILISYAVVNAITAIYQSFLGLRLPSLFGGLRCILPTKAATSAAPAARSRRNPKGKRPANFMLKDSL